MRNEQSVTLSLLLILGILILMLSPWGEWLSSVLDQLLVHHDVNLNFSPFSGGGSSTNSTQQQENKGTQQFTIPLSGGGSVTVNANSLAAALQNAQQETGIAPAGYLQ